jgi:glutamate-1-semialdehyde 2,1-aminomutase
MGSMLTPFFTAARVRDYRSALTSDTEAFALFFREMLKRGVYLPPSQFEAWFISAAHTARDIATTVDAARASLQVVARRARRRLA